MADGLEYDFGKGKWKGKIVAGIVGGALALGLSVGYGKCNVETKIDAPLPVQVAPAK